MSPEVFFLSCANPKDPIRWHLREAVLARLRVEQPVIILTPEVVESTRMNFLCSAWAWMDERAAGNYLWIVDDNMPANRNFIPKGFPLLDTFSEFGMISARDIHVKLPTEGEVVDILEPCGPTWARKGVMGPVLAKYRREWDRTNDALMAEWVRRETPWRIGKARDVTFTDLGIKLGTLWPDDFKSGLTQIAE